MMTTVIMKKILRSRLKDIAFSLRRLRYSAPCRAAIIGPTHTANWARGRMAYCRPVPILTHLELRTVPNALQGIPAVVLLLAATILEVSGDAVVRTAIYNHVGLARAGLFFTGAALLLGYRGISRGLIIEPPAFLTTAVAQVNNWVAQRMGAIVGTAQ